MGQHMLITYTEAPTFPPADPSWDSVQIEGYVDRLVKSYQARVRPAIDKLTEHELDDLLEEVGIEWIDEDEDGERMDDARVRRRQESDLAELADGAIENLFKRDWREITALAIGGVLYWFSGGPSYGDSPTDAYDDLILVDRLGVFREKLEEVL